MRVEVKKNRGEPFARQALRQEARSKLGNFARRERDILISRLACTSRFELLK